MRIPTKIKVGRRTYITKWVPWLSRSRRGHWDSRGHITLGVYDELGRHYTDKEKAEAFWHELTHAVLHDMKHPLCTNEKFVEAFARRLNNSIHSAEFT